MNDHPITRSGLRDAITARHAALARATGLIRRARRDGHITPAEERDIIALEHDRHDADIRAIRAGTAS